MGYEGRDYRRSRGQDVGYGDREDRGRYGRPTGYDHEDRGFFDRAGDEVRSWFGDEDAERRRRQDDREYERRYGPERSGWTSAYDRDDYRRRDYAPGGYGSGGFGYRDAVSNSYAPFRGDTYRENSERSDPRYHEWRSREIELLDRDYDEYRHEHQSRFDDDFGSWRSNRQTQRRSLGTVREHQEVVGSDGAHVGTVDHVRGDRILLTKTDENAGGRHHSVPCSWIRNVSDKIELNRSASEAQQAWKDEEQRSAFGRDDESDGPHILNRSFSGTY